MLKRKKVGALWLLLGPLVVIACGDDASSDGSLDVILESEELVVEGIQPGDGEASVRDGWAVEFDRYIVAVGAIEVSLSSDPASKARAPELFAVDLTQLPASGLPLWRLDGLTEGRWQFNYATRSDGALLTRHESVSTSDFDRVVENEWTYRVEGQLTKSTGQSCPPSKLASPGTKTPNGETSGGNPCYDAPAVAFRFGLAAATLFGPCEVDELPGFAVAAGSRQTVAITIHGDHLFFNGFPEGGEGGVLRLAQWLADCDLDLDGEVTTQELRAVAPSALPELDERYQLGGSPVAPLLNMQDYLAAQLMTQGHFQGEGECPVRSP